MAPPRAVDLLTAQLLDLSAPSRIGRKRSRRLALPGRNGSSSTPELTAVGGAS
jgi:hypothetical protein